jgi:hypothetical protein
MEAKMELRDKHRKHQEKIEQLINKVIVLKQENRVIMKEPFLVKEQPTGMSSLARSLTVRILGLPPRRRLQSRMFMTAS